ncbi:hypothetical protein [uncultured Pseudodesulfovibrio sp.]|uniref:hypothetical protein n=1 Tax=uncultured Pseudodesulfovibrio sp. TaxID=2035858 RepID=UPI0029C7477E|nr:hypothetical protein [uncultured Pseudodesulfovibrio sp.]
MCRFSRILVIAVSVALLTLSLAMAGAKFKNVDTAKDRKDNVFGTDAAEDTSTTKFGTDESGDSTIKTKARPKKEPVDWYDKVIITVNPNTRWPQEGSTTTTQTRYDNATDTEVTTTTTEEIK